MQKRIIALLLILLLFPCCVANADGLKFPEVFESSEVEFQEMYTTAYMVSGTTATGTQTRYGICACNTHHGDLAVVYTMDGEYLATLICVDSGSTEGLKAGRVIDVWFPTYEECKSWCEKTNLKVMVRWIEGEG